MSSARVRCRTCGRTAVWCVAWLEELHQEGGRWLHATDAIRSPGQPQAAGDAHPVVPERAP